MYDAKELASTFHKKESTIVEVINKKPQKKSRAY